MSDTRLFGGALFSAGLTYGDANEPADGGSTTKRGGRGFAAALVATSSLVFASPSFADVIHVPVDFPTIQEAIDASMNGDEIIVGHGTYEELIDFLGKTIIVRSSGGQEVTIIDGNDLGTVVTCEGGEGPGTTLKGFTVTDGSTHGMYIGGASQATVTDCNFISNWAGARGGGMFNAGSVTLTNCVFQDNYAYWDAGAGMYNSGDATLVNCMFVGNYTDEIDNYGDGAGLYDVGAATIIGCTFENNIAGYYFSAGGAYGGLVFIDCIFKGNSAGSGGGVRTGGILINCTFDGNDCANFSGVGGGAVRGDATIINCTFTGNESWQNSGGAVAGDATITNSLFVGNSSTFYGGAVLGDAIITNCTFFDNSVHPDWGIAGGAISGDAIVSNSILWGNTPDQIDGSESPVVTYSNVEGGWPGDGNIDADPLFVDPDNGDYRLAPGSPCIDAADNEAVPKGVTTDLDGNPRFVDDPTTKDTGNGEPPIVDMGAYEFQVVSCVWDLNNNGAVGTGDLIVLLGSWGDPYGTADLIELLGNWGLCP